MKEEIKDKINKFFGDYPLKKVSKNQILVYAGENPEAINYLISGKVRQYDISAKGDEIVVNIFKPPAFFPMSWAINRGQNDYFFETLTDVEMRSAPPDAAVKFLLENPDVMLNLLSRLYSGIDGLTRRMAHLMGGSAKSRLLFEIITEVDRFGEKVSDKVYKVSVNESALATRTGMSRETVSRQMSSLKEQKLVEISRGGLLINNYDQLKKELGQYL